MKNSLLTQFFNIFCFFFFRFILQSLFMILVLFISSFFVGQYDLTMYDHRNLRYDFSTLVSLKAMMRWSHIF